MERITRALDLARAYREQRGSEPLPDEFAPPFAPSIARLPEEPAPVAPIVTPHAETLERERILPPGAGGRHSAPYKLLRTQVLKRLDQLGANTLAIISASADDGKTLTAINLAIAIAAELGRTALLVDFDLRHPSVHRRLGFEPEAGVEECLQSGRPVRDVLVRLAGYERLALLPARESIEHSSELLASQRAALITAELRARYSNRILIFDLPPVLEADDALAFSRLVQAGLVVVAEGHTQRENVTRTVELLRDLPLVGTVLNASREPSRSYY